MKRIRTLNDPTPGLARYLEIATQRGSWAQFHDYEQGRAYRELIDELTDLQHGLCGYCEIALTDLDRQAEHVVPQDDPAQGAQRALDCRNLMACCKGGTERMFAPDVRADRDRYLDPVPHNRSCGQAKDNRVNGDFVDPRDLPPSPSLMRVLDDGRIEADAEACVSAGVAETRVANTIEMLNLNAERLRVQRERRWNALNDEWVEHLDVPALIDAAARGALLPDGGRLPGFFTTSRCFFGPVAERILDEQPQSWI